MILRNFIILYTLMILGFFGYKVLNYFFSRKACYRIMNNFNITKKYKKIIFNFMKEKYTLSIIDRVIGWDEDIYKDKNKLKNIIWELYTGYILDDLEGQLIQNNINEKYINYNHYCYENLLNKTKSLIRDRHYKLNGLVTENVLNLINVLNKTTKNISDMDKVKSELLLKKCCETLYSFFDVINELDNEYEKEDYKLICPTKYPDIFSDLDDGRQTLITIKNRLSNEMEVI